MATTVALTGICLTVAVAVPNDSVDPAVGVANVTPLAPATPLVAMVTVAAPEDAVPGLALVVAEATLCPCFCDITPRLGTMRMVVLPGLESDDVTVEKVRALGSAIVTARAGMSRMAVSPCPMALTKVAVPGGIIVGGGFAVKDSVLVKGAGLDVGAGEGCGGVTCSVAEMPLAEELPALARMSGVSLRVAIMSGVMRSTV